MAKKKYLNQGTTREDAGLRRDIPLIPCIASLHVLITLQLPHHVIQWRSGAGCLLVPSYWRQPAVDWFYLFTYLWKGETECAGAYWIQDWGSCSDMRKKQSLLPLGKCQSTRHTVHILGLQVHSSTGRRLCQHGNPGLSLKSLPCKTPAPQCNCTPCCRASTPCHYMLCFHLPPLSLSALFFSRFPWPLSLVQLCFWGLLSKQHSLLSFSMRFTLHSWFLPACFPPHLSSAHPWHSANHGNLHKKKRRERRISLSPIIPPGCHVRLSDLRSQTRWFYPEQIKTVYRIPCIGWSEEKQWQWSYELQKRLACKNCHMMQFLVPVWQKFITQRLIEHY